MTINWSSLIKDFFSTTASGGNGLASSSSGEQGAAHHSTVVKSSAHAVTKMGKQKMEYWIQKYGFDVLFFVVGMILVIASFKQPTIINMTDMAALA